MTVNTHSCGASWTGASRCHCSGCHVTWTGITSFDRHRRDGECLPLDAIDKHGDRIFEARETRHGVIYGIPSTGEDFTERCDS